MYPTKSEEAFRGSIFRVEVEHWANPERRRDLVRHPGAAAVLAIAGGDRVVLVRQVRESLRDVLLEIPAGIYDVSGESPEETARREVEEETGYRVASIEPLGRIHTSPGFTDEAIDLFRAEVEAAGKPERGIEVVEMLLEEALAALGQEITDAKTIAALLLHARGGPPPETGVASPA